MVFYCSATCRTTFACCCVPFYCSCIDPMEISCVSANRPRPFPNHATSTCQVLLRLLHTLSCLRPLTALLRLVASAQFATWKWFVICLNRCSDERFFRSVCVYPVFFRSKIPRSCTCKTPECTSRRYFQGEKSVSCGLYNSAIGIGLAASEIFTDESRLAQTHVMLLRRLSAYSVSRPWQYWC